MFRFSASNSETDVCVVTVQMFRMNWLLNWEPERWLPSSSSQQQQQHHTLPSFWRLCICSSVDTYALYANHHYHFHHHCAFCCAVTEQGYVLRRRGNYREVHNVLDFVRKIFAGFFTCTKPVCICLELFENMITVIIKQCCVHRAGSNKRCCNYNPI